MNSSPAVKASSPIDPAALAARFEAAAKPAGFRVERFGEIASVPLAALTKRTPGPRPRIYLSAGIHGDEPAPPLALPEMLEGGIFDHRANWFVIPLLNPAGFLRATRENADGLDLNRDYKALRSAEIRAHQKWLQRQPNFDLTMCLHEDWESKGFYLYELNTAGSPTLADAMLTAVSKVCPVETATIIDERPIDVPGIIRPNPDPQLRELWPESIYLQAHHAKLSYTIESPSAFPLPQRVATLRAAVETAITGLVRDMK